MPADWPTFIQEVSDKLSSQTIKSKTEMAELVSDQYVKATVNKAQSPFGNTHQSGKKEILFLAFKKALDELETNPGPTFEEKEKDPAFANLEEEIPKAPTIDFAQEKEFLAWAKENPSSSPDFRYFQFFSPDKPIPKTAEEAIPAIAERILFQNDGTVVFKSWVSLLNFGFAGEIGKKVEEEYKKLTEGLSDDAIRNKKEKIKLSRKIFQIDYTEGQKGVPEFLTKQFIAKFTYTGKAELTISAGVSLAGDLIRNVTNSDGVSSKLKEKVRDYGSPTSGEYQGYLDALQKWTQSLAQKSTEEEKKASTQEAKDPYEIMAKGVLDYWKSALQQPLSANPPVPPCVIAPPGLGLYIPVSYGNQKQLADLLRRAWNSGKQLKFPGSEKPASKLVASALAVCFATHLLQLKFIYSGGIPTPSGPAPMIGFVPFVF